MRLGKRTRHAASLMDYLRRKGTTLSDFVTSTNVSYEDVLRYCKDFHLTPPDRSDFDAVAKIPLTPQEEVCVVESSPDANLDAGVVRLWESIYASSVREETREETDRIGEERVVDSLNVRPTKRKKSKDV